MGNNAVKHLLITGVIGSILSICIFKFVLVESGQIEMREMLEVVARPFIITVTAISAVVGLIVGIFTSIDKGE